jgi:alpha-galactosidase
MPLALYSEGLRPVKAARNYSGDTMRIAGVRHLRGLGLQSVAVMPLQLDGRGTRFQALVGADDRGNPEIPVRFLVLGDGRVLFESAPMRVGAVPVEVDIDITGIRRLGLLVLDDVGGIYNKRTYANWVDARITMTADARPGPVPNEGERYILTPAPPARPRITSPRAFGVRPGHPFLYRITATGLRPLRFKVTGLPSGLSLDSISGVISGRADAQGEHVVRLQAENAHGRDTATLRVRIGEAIALTPPMGWNGWNSWAHHIDREKVLASARAMVDKGLADHGWTYVNIDDTWQGVRSGPSHALQPNAKFPDIAGMVDSIHAMGLKAGIYSTPYISTYAGYPGGSSDHPAGGETHEEISKNRQPYMRIGPYRFEEDDARQMAAWGFDFLKYDWRMDVASAERMFGALRRSGRDIVLSLSNIAPFEKVRDWVRTSNMYRTGPDIRDSWHSLYMTGFSLDRWGPFAGPGHWSDPDMMIVGNLSIGSEMHPSRLTPDEQYSHVSLWALLSAPLLIGCPIEQLDDLTLGLLTNDEVIAVDQDPLGRPARLLSDTLGFQTWLKPMADGSYVAGLFHTAEYGRTPQSYFRWGDERPGAYTLRPGAMGLKGRWRARDLWRQADLPGDADGLTLSIPHHGVRLLRLTPIR